MSAVENNAQCIVFLFPSQPLYNIFFLLPLVFALASQSKLENLSCHLSFLKARVNVQTLLVTLLLLSGRLAED